MAVLLIAMPSYGGVLLDTENVPEDLQPLVRSLHPKHGSFTIGDGLATLKTPEGFSYLPPDQTRVLVNQIIGLTGYSINLGSFVPDRIDLGSPATWAAVITYRPDGHLATDSLAEIDPLYLIQELIKQTNERNAKISQIGMRGLSTYLDGWASQPVYEPKTHRFFWGLETEEQSSKLHLISYYLYIPGRRGTIVLKISADFQLLPLIKGSIKPLLHSIAFNAPDRYEDFDAAHDKKSGYSAMDAILGHLSAPKDATVDTTSTSASSPAPSRVEGLLFIFLLLSALIVLRAKWYSKS